MYPYYYQQQSPGLVSVRNIQEAQSYPVAPGNSVIFHDENAPYIYTKTMGNAFDQPRFEKYRLVKEEVALQETKSEFDVLRAEIDRIKKELGMEDQNELTKSV